MKPENSTAALRSQWVPGPSVGVLLQLHAVAENDAEQADERDERKGTVLADCMGTLAQL